MTVFTIFFEADFMKKEDVKSYSITENEHSGLELELQFMPRFFMENPGALTPPDFVIAYPKNLHQRV